MSTPKKKAAPKKPAAKKKAPSSKASSSKAEKPKASKVPDPKALYPKQEIDPSKLPEGEAKKRVGAIYKLEKKLENARAREKVARDAAKAAKAERVAAEEALGQEIQEQRFGLGPLFAPDAGHAPEPKAEAKKPEPKKPEPEAVKADDKK